MLTCSAGDVYDSALALPCGAHIELGALTSAVPTARTWARMLWSCWGLTRLSDDASIVLTELTTNAILHARGEAVDIWLRADRRSLAIFVGDSCPDMPVRADALSDDELFGRGLVIVESLARHWGSYRVPTGKIVWAVLASDGL